MSLFILDWVPTMSVKLALSCPRTDPLSKLSHVPVNQVCHIHCCQRIDSPDDTLINKYPIVLQKSVITNSLSSSKRSITH